MRADQPQPAIQRTRNAQPMIPRAPPATMAAGAGHLKIWGRARRKGSGEGTEKRNSGVLTRIICQSGPFPIPRAKSDVRNATAPESPSVLSGGVILSRPIHMQFSDNNIDHVQTVTLCTSLSVLHAATSRRQMPSYYQLQSLRIGDS